MANNQVSTDVRGQLEKMETQFVRALPPHVPVERFMRVVMTAVNGNEALLRADKSSLFESCMKAAQDGLLPDGRDGALVIFNSKVKVDNRESYIEKVQWMPMIGGILKKVRNSGTLLSISANVVYENDKFTYRLGDEERIEHEPALEDAGKPKLVYAIARTKDGGIYREVMTLSQVEKVRNVSRAKNAGPWRDWWDEMAKKTVLRRLSKRLPTSADLDDLIRRDDDLYDFSGKRAESAGFTPITNPLKDDPKTLDHVPSSNNEDRDEGEDQRTAGATAETAKDLAAPGAAAGARNEAARIIEEDGIMSKDDGSDKPSPILDYRFDEPFFNTFDEWVESCTDQEFATRFSPVSGHPVETKRREPASSIQEGKINTPSGAAEKAQEKPDDKPATEQREIAKTAPAAAAAPRRSLETAPYGNAGEYIEYIRSFFDAATSEAKVNQEWGSTRTDRNTLLDAAAIEMLTKEKATALKRIRAGAEQ
jgi:recombination protein RecT